MASSAALDPYKMLPGIDGQTRYYFERLANAFHAKTGAYLRVRSGTRSCSYQNSLYAQGRTTEGPIVTSSPGCQSWHVLGRAVDCDPVDKAGNILGKDAYATMGSIWKGMGGRWGGDFDFYDGGHVEWRPNLKIQSFCPDPSNCSSMRPIDTREWKPQMGVIGLLLVGGIAAAGTIWYLGR